MAKANSTLVTFAKKGLHDYWKAGDRDGYIAKALESSVTILGVRPTRPTAGRWYNLFDELRDTEGDVWISRQGDEIWWTVSEPGQLRESLQPADRPDLHGPEVWVLEKPCRPWSDRDGQGRPLRWSAVHRKAQDFLSTEATFQTLNNDRGYADYARALVAGDPLDVWHAQPLFTAKAAEAKRNLGRIFSPKEKSAAEMASTMLGTVAQANGQIVERRVKEKTTTLSREECEALILRLMGEQEDRCALTGLPLGYVGDCDDKQMLASLDRIDSGGHYTPDNVQVVCRFINRWKGADDDQLARRLIGALRSGITRQ
ncbi:MAG: hypothetical protein C0461_06130 [Brevundimonas sp.]|nr:hypothetical protein [Brevundimonas sp.]